MSYAAEIARQERKLEKMYERRPDPEGRRRANNLAAGEASKRRAS